jgi:hypothetical protein
MWIWSNTLYNKYYAYLITYSIYDKTNGIDMNELYWFLSLAEENEFWFTQKHDC